MFAKWVALSCWLALAFAGRLGAQVSHFSVKSWTTDEGLPSNEIPALLQTKDGYLWLGTLDGLVRFDGLHFTAFDESNTKGLTDNKIVYLFEDSKTNFWVGSESGEVFLIKNGVVKSLDIKQRLHSGRLVAICEDKLGAVWLLTADGQLLRYLRGDVNVWNINAKSDPANLARTMICDSEGNLWIAYPTRMMRVNPAKVEGQQSALPVERNIPLNYAVDYLLARARGGFWFLAGGHVQRVEGTQTVDYGAYPWNKAVFTASEDLEGNLIVGTLGDGLWWYDANGKARQINSSEGLTHNYVLALLVDHEGTLWVGTDGGGLNRLTKQAFTLVPGTGSLTVQSTAVEQGTNLWLNTKGGLLHLAGGEAKLFGAEQGLLNTNGQVVLVRKSGEVWAGAGGPVNSPGLFVLRGEKFEAVTGTGKLDQQITALCEDTGGTLWVGTQGGLGVFTNGTWKIYTQTEGLSSDNVQALAEDRNGEMWVGTRNGLNHLHEGKWSVTHEGDGLPGENISSVLWDKDGVLWVATHGRGLGRYEHGKWARLGVVQGLLNDNIGYLQEDDEGNLWLGSNSGLLRLRKGELAEFAKGMTNQFSCRAYAKSDGLPTGECSSGSQPATARNSEGRLFFPTIKGLVTVDPAQIRTNTSPPIVVIEGLAISGKAVMTNALAAIPAMLVVPPNQERLEIRFASLNLANADKARFKYRLQGHENSWTETDGTVRSVSYSLLPPGDYEFQVTACNEDGIWNRNGASIAVFVEPAFWQTWWFKVCVALAILGWIIVVVNRYTTRRWQLKLEGMRQQQAVEHERARIARDIHDQLGASMTQVSLLGEMVESDKNEPAEVEMYGRQISQTARETSRVLDEIVWTVNPSNDTLEGLTNYICKYAQEYFAVAGVRFRLDVPATLPEATILPEVRHNIFLAAKETVTNVVKHAKASEVWLRMKIEEKQLIVELQDNGRGPGDMAGKESRNGLRNLRKRMEDVGGSFSLTAVPEGGALARLTVPLKLKR